MINHGGRYEMRDGKRELIERTKPAPDKTIKTAPKPAPAKAPKAAAKPAPESDDSVKEKDNG